jgi:hypothetical protein
VPTALECPEWETVGAPPAIPNAVVEALSHLGVTHVDIPITPEKVWQAVEEGGRRRVKRKRRLVNHMRWPCLRVAHCHIDQAFA